MRSYPCLTINQISAALGIRMACLIFFVAMVFAGSNARVFADQPVATATLSGPNNEQPIARREPASESRKYAQSFWLFERNYY